MPEETKETIINTDKKAAATVAKAVFGDRKMKAPIRRGGMSRGGREERPADEYEQRIVDIARVTRVMAGGKRMRFRACVAVGDKKGKIAVGLAKGADVTMAVNKAVNKAKKEFITVPMINETIPHDLYHKYGAAKIILKPAKKGHGIIAGGAARVIFELAGIKNITSKILGTNNKVNNVKCLIEAFKRLKTVEKKAKVEKKEVKAEEKAEIKK